MGELQFAVLTWQGFPLIAAAAAKVRAPRRFATAVAGYRLVPSALVEPLAWSVAGVEVILGAGLIGRWHPKITRRLAAALFASFGLAMASALLRGRRPSCGCGVGEDRPVSWLLVAQTGGLAILASLSSAVPPPLGLQVLWRATSDLSRGAALATVGATSATALKSRFQVQGTPYGVVIDGDGPVAAVGIPNKADDISRPVEAAERHIILSRPARVDHGAGTQQAAPVR